MESRRNWKRRGLRGVGYALFVLVCYGIFTWWMFPYPELARRAEAELLRNGVTAEIEGLGPGSILGVAADRVTLRPADHPDLSLVLTRARARLPAAALLRGSGTVAVDAQLLGGTAQAEGSWASMPSVRGSWEGIDLAALPLPAELAEVPFEGQSSGNVSATVDPARPAELDGRLSLQLTGVKIGAGKARGIPVPELTLGQGRVELTAEDGKVEVTAAEFEGGDLDIDFKGSLLLREDVARSLVNGILSLRPGEKASRDLALLFAVFPGAKGSDGRYTARVRGSLEAPRLLKR